MPKETFLPLSGEPADYAMSLLCAWGRQGAGGKPRRKQSRSTEMLSNLRAGTCPSSLSLRIKIRSSSGSWLFLLKLMCSCPLQEIIPQVKEEDSLGVKSTSVCRTKGRMASGSCNAPGLDKVKPCLLLSGVCGEAFLRKHLDQIASLKSEKLTQGSAISLYPSAGLSGTIAWR